MTGSEVKTARTDLGLSQEKLAQELGVTSSTVARWEQMRDEEIPTSRMLFLSLEYLKLSTRKPSKK